MRPSPARDAGHPVLLLVAKAHPSGRDGRTWTAAAGAARDVGSLVDVLPTLRGACERFVAGFGADRDIVAQAELAGRTEATPPSAMLPYIIDSHPDADKRPHVERRVGEAHAA